MRKSPPARLIQSRVAVRASQPGGSSGSGRDARSERRRLLQAEIRGSVVRAAQRLILKRGFGRLTMDALAREAQFSKATLYKYFGSKTEMVGAIFINYFDRIRDKLSGIRKTDSGHAEQFKQLIRAVLESHEESRNLSQALLLDEAFMKRMGVILADERRISAEERKFVKQMKARLQELNAIVEDFLSQGVRDGVFRETDRAMTVKLLSAAINGFCHQLPWMPVETGVEEATDFIHEFFMYGLVHRRESRKGEKK